jgi:glycosyltransferase involved in cell wall biosynthesis
VRVHTPTVALLPWGDLIEDFLDAIDVSLDAFCEEMTGGWLFGYIAALERVGVRTVVVCVSGRVQEPIRYMNKPTGAAVWVLPPSATYLRLRRRNAHVPSYAPYLSTPLRRLATVLKKERCTAILCQEYEYERFDACTLLGKLLRLPVYATFQGGNWQRSRLERLTRPLSLRGSAGVIIASGSEAERVRHRYGVPERKIARIFNPIDLEMWHPVEARGTRADLGITLQARVVVWHGRVDMHRKGLDVLLNAWRAVRRERPGQDVWLLLVGSGSDAPHLRTQLEQLGDQGVVWLEGYTLDRAAMRRYLSAADLYVLPSRHEGFPVAPIEAMACGLPIVAADAPGVSDILAAGEAHGGLVVPREDVPALAGALGRLIDQPDWARELGLKARARVEQAFSLPVVGAQLAALLEGAPAGHRSERLSLKEAA